jgi:hypothetical protein
MRISDGVLKSVAPIGTMTEGVFVPRGMAFIATLTQERARFHYLVTARHILDELDGPVTVRLNTKDGAAYFKPAGEWHHQPQEPCLVSVTPITPDPSEYEFVAIATRDFCLDDQVSSRSLAVGDELFYPVVLPQAAADKNYPLARFGVLSATAVHAVETIEGPARVHLMEGHSVTGHHGSPVFVNLMARRSFSPERPVMLTNLHQASRYQLLGLISGHLTITTGESRITRDALDPQAMSGLISVAPARAIMDTLMQDALQRLRSGKARAVAL